MFNKKMMTSKRQDWRTPKKIYDELNKEFSFDFDPCTLSTNTIHAVDMLGSSWNGSAIYVNPPNKDLAKWIKKSWEEWRIRGNK